MRYYADGAYTNGIEALAAVVRYQHKDKEIKACGRDLRAAWDKQDFEGYRSALERLEGRCEAIEASILQSSVPGALIDLRAAINAQRYKLYDFASECYKRGIRNLEVAVKMRYPGNREINNCARIIIRSWKNRALDSMAGELNKLEQITRQ